MSQVYSTSNILKKTGITQRQLYYWEKRGIIQPQLMKFGTRKFRNYKESDVMVLRRVKRYIKNGYTLDKAGEKAKLDTNRLNKK